MPTPDDSILQNVLEIFRTSSLTPLLVGGAVRDLLLKQKPKDLDFLVAGESMGMFVNLMDKLAASLNLNIVRPAAFPEVMRLVSRTHSLDFTFVSSEKVTENLMQRDFTINAMAMNLATKEILDPSEGTEDLNGRRLRMVREDAFKKDPVRIVRLFRFQTELGFTPNNDTIAQAKEAASFLSLPAGERIREEFFKILANDRGFDAISEMTDPILMTLFPSIAAIRDIPQNGYHHLNVLDHTLAVLSRTFRLNEVTSLLHSPELPFSEEDKIVLRLSALFHDVGKAHTLSWNENGITTFKKHQFHSADLFLTDIGRLKPSNRLTERVYMVIRRHMLFLNFMLNGWSDKSFRKLINMMREDSRLLVLLACADKLSAEGPLSAGSAEQMTEIGCAFMETYKKDAETITRLPKLVSGKEVMDLLGLSPSPEVGKVLSIIAEKQLADPAFNREQALAILNSYPKKQKGETI
ncbi:MAG: hypothetical protein CO090_08770 [Acidobacteria bacterium CG_4_9_14_3_um_filter_49_7]|nr:MAG: hypothetical protein CO090_08770 [Acidobacteria bacterium CG_4_9_14_3_um_filter_49_7]